MTPDALDYELQSEDQLCFVRIHKTAGTTLVNLLENHFSASKIHPLSQLLFESRPQEIQPYRCFYGHYAYDVYQQYVQKPVYITLLRHPVERVISLYQHARRIDHPVGVEQAHLQQAATGSLQEFLRSGDPFVNMLTINAQTRQIATQLYVDPTIPEERVKQPSDHDLLERARSHLDHWPFFGITEQFRESVALLSYVFGWYPDLSYQSVNRSPNRLTQESIDPATLEEIQTRTQLDLELYLYAKASFQKCVQMMDDRLQNAYGSSPSPFLEERATGLLPLLLRHYEQRRNDRPVTACDRLQFDFSQPIAGTGWHKRTRLDLPHPAPPLYFRWTGPGRETVLDLPPLTAARAMVHLHLLNSAAADVLNSTRLFVNQVPVPLQLVQATGRGGRFQGEIPPTAMQGRNVLRLVLHVDRTIPLNEVNPQRRDRYPVGLAVSSIEVIGRTTSTLAQRQGKWAIGLVGLILLSLVLFNLRHCLIGECF